VLEAAVKGLQREAINQPIAGWVYQKPKKAQKIYSNDRKL
jgi:hypothetical protein